MANALLKAWKRGRKIARILLWHSAMKLRTTVTTDTLQGRFTVLTADDFVAKSLYCFKQHELAWMEQALGFLRAEGRCPPPGQGTVLDIGANNGCSTVGFLNVNGVERSLAIEPDPDNFALLDLNVRQNGFDARVVRHHCALSSIEGELELERSRVNFGDHRVRMAVAEGASEAHSESKRSVVRVPARRLDALLAESPRDFVDAIAFVWIDVQGHEGYVFEGGEALFSRDIPVVAEFWPYGIRRAGMSEEAFIAIARRFWGAFWIEAPGSKGERFLHRPIDELAALFAEIGYNDTTKTNRACNIIFTK